jgi:beta-phosphoglucomutase
MIKALLFDLDNTLADLSWVHFEALNYALLEIAGGDFVIHKDDHLDRFNGLPTLKKLEILTKERNLDPALHSKISELKQSRTKNELNNLRRDWSKVNMLGFVVGEQYKVACVSNSIRETIDLALSRLEILHFFDVIVSNEDVQYPKPHSQPYTVAMKALGVSPAECLIFEDNYHGLKSGLDSGGKICYTPNPSFLTRDFVKMWVNLYNR